LGKLPLSIAHLQLTNGKFTGETRQLLNIIDITESRSYTVTSFQV